jgi:transcriptional regulator with XRE-family HTH domain
MNTTRNETLRELRRILGQTQGEFAAMIGASKDTVASWETGRNRLSAAMARQIGFATGVNEESLAAGTGVPTLTLPVAGTKAYTAEDFANHRKMTKGRAAEMGVREHLHHCADTLELILLAAAGGGGEANRLRVMGVLLSFIEWSEGVRRDFGLGPQIDAQLERRKAKAGITLSYGQWRRMTREDPAALQAVGFKDDFRKRPDEPLRLEMEVRPAWLPGRRMHLPHAAGTVAVGPKNKAEG